MLIKFLVNTQVSWQINLFPSICRKRPQFAIFSLILHNWCLIYIFSILLIEPFLLLPTTIDMSGYLSLRPRNSNSAIGWPFFGLGLVSVKALSHWHLWFILKLFVVVLNVLKVKFVPSDLLLVSVIYNVRSEVNV